MMTRKMYRESFLVAALTLSSYAIPPVHDPAEADGFAPISTWECVTEYPPMVRISNLLWATPPSLRGR